MRRHTSPVALPVSLIALTATSTQAQSFRGLGHFPGDTISVATGLSADGTVVVGAGNSPSSAPHVVLWEAGGPPENLGLPGGYYSRAPVISADGRFIAGGLSPDHIYRWSRAGGVEDLGRGPYQLVWCNVTGISADGSVIVGYYSVAAGYYSGFRWDASHGVTSLGLGNNVRVTGLSGDGLVAIGHRQANRWTAFRWSEAGGLVDLPSLPGTTDTFAYCVNHDASVIAGGSFTPVGIERLTLWTPSAPPSDHGRGRCLGVADDGSGGAGLSFPVPGYAVAWRHPFGAVELQSYLSSVGIDLTGWTLYSANAVSADGRIIVGEGGHNGLSEAWIADLGDPCYANCDGSTSPPVLSAPDFACFLQRFSAGSPYANCDGSIAPPVLNVADFACFLERFASGCP